ncbi:hypothetical protein BSK54_07985 [Paenibacillus odorifer]|uniref:hypothetical protein n=1 Tax=Paenibacillus odorifer TaxID=189426 RepID=UPI00097001E1|nr:hypothetical protein [Paenibacillus odorifer]OME03381.1 hypothetical protein BSK54_07985 [Paenibacillus odorifer]
MINEEELKKYQKVTIEVFSLPARNIIEGPEESEFYFDNGDLYLPGIKKIYNKALLDLAQQTDNTVAVLWKYGVTPVAILLTFS